MIRMSRSDLDLGRALPRQPRHRGVLALWHAACLCSISGCFYIKPIPQIEVNQLPDITVPLNNPETRRVTSDRITLTVVATDPDGDPISFEWPDLDDVDHLREERQDGEYYRSRVEITELDALQSDVITALVYDDRPLNTVPVVFYLELP